MAEELYKYCDEDGVKILETLKIKVTPPDELNDPFEALPAFKNDLTGEVLIRLFDNEEWVREQLRRMEDSPTPPPRDAIELIRKVGDKNQPQAWREMVALLYAQSMTQGVGPHVRETQSVWSQHLGFLCLSRTPNDIPMWAHYADKHRGLVIGFDRNYLPMQERFTDVIYSPQRFAVSPLDYLSDDAEQQVDGTLFQKSDAWTNEREVRATVPLDPSNQITLKKGATAYALSVKAETIVSVKLGLRFPENSVTGIRDAMKRSGINAKLERAFLAEDTYEIRFRDV